jgi:AraC-like DNA-binding protein
MNIENPPIFQGVNLGSVEDPGRPVLSLDWSAEGPHNVAGHVHPRAQIIYQRTGVYRVNTAQGNWVVPPSQAIWIPSMVYHETFTNNSASALMLFVDRRYTGVLPQECMVVGVSSLLSELFIRAAKYGNDYPPSGREARLVQVMLDEFGGLQPAPLNLPLAADNRVRRILDLLIAEPGENRGIDQLALACGASSRTLSRLFRKETGMTFIEWRKRLRLLEAIDRLGQGQSTTQVAFDMGYGSSSAFIAMFRRTLGAPPGRYLQTTSIKSRGHN